MSNSKMLTENRMPAFDVYKKAFRQHKLLAKGRVSGIVHFDAQGNLEEAEGDVIHKYWCDNDESHVEAYKDNYALLRAYNTATKGESVISIIARAFTIELLTEHELKKFKDRIRAWRLIDKKSKTQCEAGTSSTTDKDTFDEESTDEESTDKETTAEESTDETSTAEESTDETSTAEESTDETSTAEESTDETSTAEECVRCRHCKCGTVTKDDAYVEGQQAAEIAQAAQQAEAQAQQDELDAELDAPTANEVMHQEQWVRASVVDYKNYYNTCEPADKCSVQRFAKNMVSPWSYAGRFMDANIDKLTHLPAIRRVKQTLGTLAGVLGTLDIWDFANDDLNVYIMPPNLLTIPQMFDWMHAAFAEVDDNEVYKLRVRSSMMFYLAQLGHPVYASDLRHVREVRSVFMVFARLNAGDMGEM